LPSRLRRELPQRLPLLTDLGNYLRPTHLVKSRTGAEVFERNGLQRINAVEKKYPDCRDVTAERIGLMLERRGLIERLCRYVSRPPLAVDRLALTSSGQVRYTLKTAYRDGTTHVMMEPLDFMARLAALVPPPRMHLTRVFGIEIDRCAGCSGTLKVIAGSAEAVTVAVTPEEARQSDGGKGLRRTHGSGVGRFASRDQLAAVMRQFVVHLA
jgi:Putative transposase